MSVDPVHGGLADGALRVLGQIRGASNAVLYCEAGDGGSAVACVYKPVAGERPLWDFPDGTLAEREVAAYEVSRALGWDLVPVTVLREGPYGPGMVQEWVGALPQDAGEGGEGDESDEDGEDGDAEDDSPLGPFLDLVEAEEPGPGWKAVGFAETAPGRTALLVHADDARLRRLAVLDAVLNNADRKGGHLLTTSDGQLRAIDHGVTFHTDDKLRTLLWGWAGEELTAEAVAALRRLAATLAEGAPLARRLGELLTAAEVDAVRKRVDALLAAGRHPMPGGDWPAIPWPPM